MGVMEGLPHLEPSCWCGSPGGGEQLEGSSGPLLPDCSICLCSGLTGWPECPQQPWRFFSLGWICPFPSLGSHSCFSDAVPTYRGLAAEVIDFPMEGKKSEGFLAFTVTQKLLFVSAGCFA